VSATFLAGYDGSDASRAAVRFARTLGEAYGGRVVAVHVHPAIPFVAGKGASERARLDLEADARADAERLLAALAEPGVETRAVAAPSAAHGLQRLAEEEHAALIAVGARHRHGLGRLVGGGVADRLLHGSPCPVAAVPARSERRLATVAVAYDGGDEARSALGAAADLAGRLGARLQLLAAIDPEAVPAIALIGAVTEIGDRLRAEKERRLAEAAESLPAGVQAETRVVPGIGAPAIVVACETEGVDLLVCGSRAYGPLRSVLVGSFSRHLVDHAPCPVLVVPRGARARFDEATAEPAEAGATA
jgi:nucleotide-binding universal stress UspA family protein